MSGGTNSGGGGQAGSQEAPGPSGGQEGPGAPTRSGGGGRYFVTVIAAGRDALVALRQHDLDLFKPTARPAGPAPGAAGGAAGAGEFRVDGLLTLEEIGRLVGAGYRVLVRESATQKARGQIAAGAAPGGAIGFEQWLKGAREER